MHNQPRSDPPDPHRLTKWTIPMLVFWAFFIFDLIFGVDNAYGLVFFAGFGIIGIVMDLSERFGTGLKRQTTRKEVIDDRTEKRIAEVIAQVIPRLIDDRDKIEKLVRECRADPDELERRAYSFSFDHPSADRYFGRTLGDELSLILMELYFIRDKLREERTTPES